MKLTFPKIGYVILFSLVLSACASSPFYHKNFMRGQVVKVDDKSAVVCIGTYKSSLVGKSLSVYRIDYVMGTQEGDDGFQREYVGTLRIDAIIDEHFARATVTDGAISQNNVVELAR